jgi:hypothetical protein
MRHRAVLKSQVSPAGKSTSFINTQLKDIQAQINECGNWEIDYSVPITLARKTLQDYNQKFAGTV